MKRLKKYLSTGLTVILSLVMAFFPTAPALAGVCNNVPDVPPFLSAGVDPNLLLVIDNSGSMYDLAYVDDSSQCYDDTYDPTLEYAGYFDNNTHYKYNLTDQKFEVITSVQASSAFSTAVGTYYERYNWTLGVLYLAMAIDATPAVTLFIAKGNYLNWAAASKFDLEKKILTGGKYYDPNGAVSNDEVLIMESRGCLGRRQVKKTQLNGKYESGAWVYQDVLTDYSTMGVRGPSETEQTADAATGSSNTTRIEIFNVTATGFDYDSCQAALDDLTADPPKLGDLKQDTKDCMGYSAQVDDMFRDSYSAFNHALQECWYYNKHGDWQPGAGTVNAIMNDCEKMYGHFPDPADITTANKGYLCYGDYGYDPVVGYVGRCWETATVVAGATLDSLTSCVIPWAYPNTGNPTTEHCINISGSTTLPDGTVVGSGDYLHVCEDAKYRIGDDDCFGGRTWVPQVALGGPGGVATPAQWTDDNAGDPDACVDQAIKDYCGIMDIPDVIDPSDAESSTGEVWNAPAVLIDSGVISQLAEPLVSMKGHIAQASEPSGLIQEFAADIRMGVMTFNEVGSKTECDNLIDNPNYPATSDKPYIFYACDPSTGPIAPELVLNCCNDPAVADKFGTCGTITMEEQIDFRCEAGNQDGGQILAYIDQSLAHTDAIVAAVNGLVGSSWTPLAEAVYNAVGYYTQRSDLRTSGAYTGAGTDDFVTHAEDSSIEDPCGAWCHDNNILLITDGSSTADQHPDVVGFAQTDGDAADNVDCGVLHGTTYLDDLTYYAKSGTNIFAEEPWEEWDPAKSEWINRKYNIKTHIVVTGTPQVTGVDECSADVLLPRAATQGGTTLYQANNPGELDAKLRLAFASIRSGAAAGSAASVISASRSGEGAIYQAIFWPNTEVDPSVGDDVSWTGEVHALLIDAYGNMYEDTQPSPGVKGNRALDVDDERVIIFFDESTKPPVTRACYPTLNSDPFNSDGSCKGVVKELKEIAYLWSAAEWLAGITDATDINENRFPYISDQQKRYIFTWNDLNNNGIVTTGEVLPFVPTTNWSGLLSIGAGAALAKPRAPVPYDFNVTTSAEVNEIVRWVRGDNSVPNRRSRLVEYDFDLNGSKDPEVWRLGDVIHSTPTSVARPAEGYHFLYKDASYGAFLNEYNKRRHVVYFGGNDGMFHAVNAGFYQEDDKKFCLALDADGDCDDAAASPALGAELWAYVPYNLLPHLNCMTYDNYQHKYYVDQRARIFDVRIWPNENPASDGVHTSGWGTILVGGMRFGGTKVRPSTDMNLDGVAGYEYGYDTREFTSSYFIMDITDPENPPVLLGEFTRTTTTGALAEVELGYTTVIPTLVTMKTGNDYDDYADWYLMLGSGPTEMDGTSTQSAKVAVIPLKDLIGASPAKSFRIPAAPPAVGTDWGTFTLTGSPNGFVSDMVTVDVELKSLYKSDAVYFGTVEGDYAEEGTGGWGGKLYRLVTRVENLAGVQQSSEPGNWAGYLSGFNPKPLIDVGQPITAAPNIARDAEGNFWVYFGTGRFFDPDDKTDSISLPFSSNAQQTYYGIKEPRDCDRNVFNDDGLTWATVENKNTNFTNYPGYAVADFGETWNTVPGTQGLLRVDQIQVRKAGNSVNSTLSCQDEDPDTAGVQVDPECQKLITAGVDTFYDLDEFIAGTGKCYDDYDETNPLADPVRGHYWTGTDGWYKNFHDDRERNLGQATLLGGLLTFTTYQPYDDVCLSEGLAALYGVYFRTGTGYFIPTFGDINVDASGNVIDKISLGRGMATTPNLHVGRQEGSTAFVQTSTGTIVEIPQPNLPIGTFKTGRQSWIEMKP